MADNTKVAWIGFLGTVVAAFIVCVLMMVSRDDSETKKPDPTSSSQVIHGDHGVQLGDVEEGATVNIGYPNDTSEKATP